MPERVDRVVVGHRRVAQHGSPEAQVDGVWLRGDGELHLLHLTPVGHGAERARDLGDGAREVNVFGLDSPHLPGQADREAAGHDRELRARAFKTGRLGDGVREPRRSGEGFGAEDGGRTAVKDDPIPDTLGVEERPPALFAHLVLLCAIHSSLSRPHARV